MASMPSLPHALEPDAVIVLQVELLEGDAGNALKLEKYPHFVAQVVCLQRRLRYVRAPFARRGLGRSSTSRGRVVLAVRRTIAALSLLIVPATYAIARCWLGPGWSLVAAAFTLVSLLMQSLAEQARLHAVVAAMAAVAVAACLWMRRRPVGQLPSGRRGYWSGAGVSAERARMRDRARRGSSLPCWRSPNTAALASRGGVGPRRPGDGRLLPVLLLFREPRGHAPHSNRPSCRQDTVRTGSTDGRRDDHDCGRAARTASRPLGQL